MVGVWGGLHSIHDAGAIAESRDEEERRRGGRGRRRRKKKKEEKEKEKEEEKKAAAERQTDTHRERKRQTDRETERQRDRDKETERQRDRQTGTETETETLGLTWAFTTSKPSPSDTLPPTRSYLTLLLFSNSSTQRASRDRESSNSGYENKVTESSKPKYPSAKLASRSPVRQQCLQVSTWCIWYESRTQSRASEGSHAHGLLWNSPLDLWPKAATQSYHTAAELPALCVGSAFDPRGAIVY